MENESPTNQNPGFRIQRLWAAVCETQPSRRRSCRARRGSRQDEEEQDEGRDQQTDGWGRRAEGANDGRRALSRLLDERFRRNDVFTGSALAAECTCFSPSQV